MAYGVKYRLDFSDDFGNGKRVEILKDGYVGSVLDTIGGSNPVTISYDFESDYYYPIITSRCEINLKETDLVTYDKFYEFGEKEYKVKVYYDDSGYNLMWEGFIISDIYTEQINTSPLNTSIVAVDGLSLLKGVDFPLAQDQFVSMWECLYSCVKETGLDLDILVKTDIKESNQLTITNVFENVNINTSAYTDSNTNFLDCYTTLYSILSGFNCRLFQDNNRWVVVNNADLSTFSDITYRRYDYLGAYIDDIVQGSEVIVPDDLTVLEQSLFKYTKGGIKETSQDIKTKEQVNYLPNGSFENDFDDWDIASLLNTSITDDAIRGRKALKTTGKNLLIGFVECASNEWDSTAKSAADDTTSFTLEFALKINNSTFPTDLGKYDVRWRLSHEMIQYYKTTDLPTGTPNNTYHYDLESTSWVSAQADNIYTYTGRGEWQKFKVKIKHNLVIETSTTIYLPYKFKFQLGYPDPSLGSGDLDYESMVFDGVTMYWDELYYWTTAGWEINIQDSEYILYNQDSLSSKSTQDSSVKVTNKSNYNNILQGSVFKRYLKSFILSSDGTYDSEPIKFKRSSDTEPRNIEDIVNQQRLNDNRDYIEEYECTVVKNDAIPLLMTDRINIDYNTYSEDKPIVIDRMTHNLKRGTYTLLTHTTNQSTDVDNTFFQNIYD